MTSTEELDALLAARGDCRKVIDLVGHDLSQLVVKDLVSVGRDPKDRPILRELKFGQRKKAPATLGSLELRGLVLSDCSFCGVVFRRTDLRGSALVKCDFRYAEFYGATLQDTQVESCDFYRAFFGDATVFEPALLEESSLTRAYLAGIVELRRENLCHPRGAPRPRRRPFAQEMSPKGYGQFLERTSADRFERKPGEKLLDAERRNRSDDLTATINARHEEAAVVWRRVAALWTSQGAYSYSGWAYVRGKRRERRHVNPFRPMYDAAVGADKEITVTRRASTPKEFWRRLNTDADKRREGMGFSLWLALRAVSTLERVLKWLVLLIADALCAFGEGLGHVFAWLAALVLIPGMVYAATDGVTVEPGKRSGDLADSMLFSLTQLVNSSPGRLHAAAHSVETVVAIQTLLGVVLLGLLGFVLGNKLHSA